MCGTRPFTMMLALVAGLSAAFVPPAAGQSIAPQDGGPRAFRLQQDMDARLLRLDQWLKAIVRHEPGATDEPAERVGSWSNAELRSLWIDANVLVQLIRNPKTAV